MIMVQKQPGFAHSPAMPSYSHRRHPSAPPAVIVHPTKTPGLLSLSKPIQRPSRPNSTQRTHPKLQLNVRNAPTTPPPNARGRQAKDKTTAAARTNSPSSRRQGHRQQSPPSQAEGPTTPTKTNYSSNPNSDPFLVPVSSQTFAPSSGKSVRKRQTPSQQDTVNSSQPVPIPRIDFKPSSKPVSRSVPLPRHRPAKRPVHINTDNAPSLLPPFDFPICDDMTEAGDLSDLDNAPTSPVTPSRPRHSYKNRNHTLPRALPFSAPPMVHKQTRPHRNHRRAPSDSGMIFNMSSDESGPEANSTSDEELRALVRSMASVGSGVRTPLPAKREWMFGAQAKKDVHGYFASSMFQNSPSPEELPDPLFV